MYNKEIFEYFKIDEEIDQILEEDYKKEEHYCRIAS